ncbi:hypothetical protein KY284_036276 [Solanum tuberosum]|nr:hypothetical protein KY284_036276 [Solanum tuberosum]
MRVVVVVENQAISTGLTPPQPTLKPHDEKREWKRSFRVTRWVPQNWEWAWCAAIFDDCTTIVERISFARIFVEMNITLALPQSVNVVDPHGRGKVVKQIWHKKSAEDTHGDAISMLAGTRANTQEEQWQNVKGKSKNHPSAST